MKNDRSSVRRRDAILHWNDLLFSCTDPASVVETLRRSQEERGLLFDGVPFCRVARPRFVTDAEMRQEQRAVNTLSGAVRRIRDAILDDQELRADLFGGFDDWLGSILSLESRHREARSILRFDSFTTEAGIRFVELNGDIPMGSVCNDGLVPVFRELDVFRAFEKRYGVRSNLVQIGVVQTLTHAWQARGGTGVPRTCVTSFRGGIEDVLIGLNADDLRMRGFEGTAAHPEDLDFHGGKLRANGQVVDLVYRIMHVADCLKRSEEIAPLLQAVKHGAVCLVNPFRAALLSHKYLFALLTDESYDFGFTPDERAAIRTHVPWGRILRDGASTDADGKRIELVEYVLAHQDDLVLKPAHEAGGAGVHLGWRCDAAGWADAVREALQSEYVVQEKIDVDHEEYPAFENGLVLKDFFEDTDPFHFPGGFSAALTRISSAEITNVAQGGSIVPTFVIDAG